MQMSICVLFKLHYCLYLSVYGHFFMKNYVLTDVLKEQKMRNSTKMYTIII